MLQWTMPRIQGSVFLFIQAESVIPVGLTDTEGTPRKRKYGSLACSNNSRMHCVRIGLPYEISQTGSRKSADESDREKQVIQRRYLVSHMLARVLSSFVSPGLEASRLGNLTEDLGSGMQGCLWMILITSCDLNAHCRHILCYEFVSMYVRLDMALLQLDMEL